MRIVKYLNATKKEIASKKFNIFIGISLGNRYFSKENIKKYIIWALENTKKDVLVIIADEIHAINYEVLNGYNPKRALAVALRKGQETQSSIEKIIHSLPKEKQHLVKIAKWKDMRNSPYYKAKIKIILKEFQENQKFHDFIISIVRENLGSKTDHLDKDSLDKLAAYVLDETPILLNGVEFNSTTYNLYPYPGLSSFDDLIARLQAGKLFTKLAKKLEIKRKIAEVEAYVD